MKPDLSAWGKCFANGQPISALLGSDSAREGAAAIFVTGSFWFGAAAMSAAIATLKIIREGSYIEHMIVLGDCLRAGLYATSERHGFKIRQTGPVQMPQLLFDDDPDFRVGFGWCERMVERGFYLHPWHNMFLCAAMTEQDIDDTIAAADLAFEALRREVESLEPHEALAQTMSAAA